MLGLPCTPGDPQRQARAAKNRNGPLQRGTKSEVAASTLPSRGPKRGQDCSVTPAFSGIPNAKRGEQKKSVVVPNKGEQNQKWLPHPCLLGGPKEGGNSRGPNAKRGEGRKTKGNKIRSGCLTPAFSVAQKRARLIRHPCILGDPQRQARGAKNQKWSPTKGNKIRSGCLTLAFSVAQKRAEMLRHPCILGDPQRQARGAKNEK